MKWSGCIYFPPLKGLLGMRKGEDCGLFGKPMPKTYTTPQMVPTLIYMSSGRAWGLGLGLCDLRQDIVLF